MPRRALPVAALLAAVVVHTGIGRTASPDPLAFLAPGAHMSAADRGRLDAGDTVVRLLPADTLELGVVAAVRTTASPERLIAWTKDIAALRRGRYVPLVSRFSNPPRIEDLEALTLDEGDLNDLRRCRGGDCDLKLGVAEMDRLQRALRGRADWKEAAQEAFRQVVLERVERYLAEGDAGLPMYEDHATPVAPAAETDALVEELGLASPHLPGVADYVRRFPRMAHPDVVESFVYWAKETFGGKPIVSVSHVMLLRRDAAAGPSVLTISKQLLATHYRTGSLSLTAMTDSGWGRHLVYVQRSHVDVLRGLFGGLVRRVMEGRVRDEAPAVLDTVRTRLESGDPP